MKGETLWEEKSDNIPVKSFTGYTVKFGGWQREKPVSEPTVPETVTTTATNDIESDNSKGVSNSETTTEQEDIKQE